ncbi:TnsD family Tn7-like transposition protein [Pseudoalteromonas sp. XMcav1-K]|uniref:TnsD family Tn7-like transposition protein n=1 Tax=Pseudoalteromonas sp. XMcav1-K TaxID=3374372 RepID=UPI0037564232
MSRANQFTFFPNPAPGETIYSWVSRYHLMSGYHSFRDRTMKALGVKEGRAFNEFPSYLPKLSHVTRTPLDYLITQMTPYNYYASFLPNDLKRNLWKSLASGTTKSLQSQLGAVANRLTPGDSFFCCRHCISEDIEKYGFPFWHMHHQITGVTVCPIHHEALHTIRRVKSSPIMPEAFIERSSGSVEERYSRIIQSMTIASEQNLIIADIQKSYYRRLNDLGFITIGKRIRFKQLSSYIYKHLTQIMPSDRAYIYLLSQLSKGRYPQSLFYLANSNHHPLKHVVLIEALFGNWSSFISEVKKPVENILLAKDSISNPKRNLQLSDIAIDMLKKGDSLRSISKVVGMSVSSIKILAQRSGFNISTRPSKVFPSTEKAILRALALGKKTSDIASKFNLSVGAIEQVLRKYSTLVPYRKRLRFLKSQIMHRNNIKQFMEANPNCTRNSIKKLISASYMWLYKHDKAWLYSSLPPALERRERFRNNN